DAVGSNEFDKGRVKGDDISMILGIGEIIVGIILLVAAVTITGAGGGVAVGSGGTLALPAAGIVIVVDTVLVLEGPISIVGGITMMMAAGRGRSGNNRDQNRQFREGIRRGEERIGRKLSKDEIRQVHNEIGRESDDEATIERIAEIVQELFG